MSSIMDKFVNKFKKDGVDHVRVALNGDTAVGRMSALEYRKTFFIPNMGSFLTPICFANWMATGDDDARHDPTYRVSKTIQGYLHYVMYAKYWQMVALREKLRPEMKQLPFVSYRVYENGIREFDRWKEYAVVIKNMIEHVLDPERGPKVPFEFPEGVVNTVENRIAEIAAAFKDASGDEGAGGNEQRKPNHKKRHNKKKPHQKEASSVAPTDNTEQEQRSAEQNGTDEGNNQPEVGVAEEQQQVLSEAAV